MKFIPTSTYTTIAQAAAKEITWNVYARIVTSLSESNTGISGWTNITNKIPKDSIPDITTKIEYEVGQFVANSITLNANDITYWKNTFFNVATGASDYIECKIHMTLSIGSLSATDNVIVYSGFIKYPNHEANVTYNELKDSVSFVVDSIQAVADKIPAENLCTQYLETDIFGSGSNSASGLILGGVIGIYVVSANLTNYELKAGVHTLEYTAGNPSFMKLDDGLNIPLSAGYVVLGDGNAEDWQYGSDDTQRLQLAITGEETLSSSYSFIEKIVVLNKGDKLPYQFYRNTNVKHILLDIFDEIGIQSTNVTFDTLELNTYNSIKKISYLDQPPSPLIDSGFITTIANDGTYLWMGVGNNLYRREISHSDNPYTLVTSLSADRIIHKLIYNARNNHLWIYCSGTNEFELIEFGVLRDNELRQQYPYGNSYINLYDIGNSTLSAEVTLSTSNDGINPYAMEVYDYNFTGSNYRYGFIYSDENADAKGALKFVSGTSLVVSTICTGSDVEADVGGTQDIKSNLLFLSGGAKQIVFTSVPDAAKTNLVSICAGTDGIWTTIFSTLANYGYQYKKATFNPVENRIYYRYNHPLNKALHSHLTNSVYTEYISTYNYSDTFYSTTGGITYISCYDTFTSKYCLSAFQNNSGSAVPGSTYNYGNSLTDLNGVLYGIDFRGLLYQVNDKINFYVKDTNSFEGQSVLATLNQLLQAFNLICILTPDKRAYVYRRSDDNGTPQTTGNTLSLDISNSKDITENVYSYSKCDLVSVSNNNKTKTYNGIEFDAGNLTMNRMIDITSELWDDYMLDDICYYMYQFFKTDKILYTIPITITPYFQFEPLDNCALSYSTTNIQKSANGPIYEITYKKDGSMEVKTLI